MSQRALLSRALVLILALAACQAAPPPTRSIDPNAPVVIPYKVAGGGEIRFTVQPRYALGAPIALDLDITAGSQGIRGPIGGHVLQSDLAGEQTIRRFAPGELGGVELAAGQTTHTTVRWDGKDDKGTPVKQDTYSLSLDFVVGGTSVALGSVIEVRAP
jgi:hypothetical protein